MTLQLAIQVYSSISLTSSSHRHQVCPRMFNIQFTTTQSPTSFAMEMVQKASISTWYAFCAARNSRSTLFQDVYDIDAGQVGGIIPNKQISCSSSSSSSSSTLAGSRAVAVEPAQQFNEEKFATWIRQLYVRKDSVMRKFPETSCVVTPPINNSNAGGEEDNKGRARERSLYVQPVLSDWVSVIGISLFCFCVGRVCLWLLIPR